MTDAPVWFTCVLAILAAISPIMVAIIGYFTSRSQKRQSEMIKSMEANAAKERKQAAENATTRQKESQHSMEMMCAACKLGIVTAKAVKGEKTNGDMEEARRDAEKAIKAYELFMMETTSKLVSG